MTKMPGPPSFNGLKKRIADHRAGTAGRVGSHVVREVISVTVS